MFPILTFLAVAPSALAFAELTPEAAAAFDRYVGQAEARMKADREPARFLRADGKPELKARLRDGQVVIEPVPPASVGEAKIPGAMLQDWRGAMFIPGASIGEVRAVLQDYPNYKNFYKPKVTESKELAHHGDEYEVFLRLFEKHLLTVVLNTNYRVQYGMLDPQHMDVISRATRIAQVKDPGKSYTDEETPGNDTGFLWRLNSNWRFEEGDGGVYAECEAISLSRDVPLGLGWMIKGFLEKFPKESMLNTLEGTREAVKARRGDGPASGR